MVPAGAIERREKACASAGRSGSARLLPAALPASGWRKDTGLGEAGAGLSGRPGI